MHWQYIIVNKENKQWNERTNPAESSAHGPMDSGKGCRQKRAGALSTVVVREDANGCPPDWFLMKTLFGINGDAYPNNPTEKGLLRWNATRSQRRIELESPRNINGWEKMGPVTSVIASSSYPETTWENDLALE